MRPYAEPGRDAVARDTVFIEGLEFVGLHGVFDHERRDGCRFRVDLEIDVDAAVAARDDRLADTVDYGRLAATVLECSRTTSFRLIESLAEAICRRVLEDLPVHRVRLTLRKLQPPVPGQPVSVGVRLVREARRPAAPR